MIIRRLAPTDARRYRGLRLRGLRESPTAFGSSHAEETKRPLRMFADRLKQTKVKWVWGAFEDGELLGVVTLIREENSKERHKASIFGMYVDRKIRGQGVGRQLLDRALDAARGMAGLKQVRLAVVATNRPARRLYAGAGFVAYGREESALFVGGKYYAELFLVCRL